MVWVFRQFLQYDICNIIIVVIFLCAKFVPTTKCGYDSYQHNTRNITFYFSGGNIIIKITMEEIKNTKPMTIKDTQSSKTVKATVLPFRNKEIYGFYIYKERK